MPESFPRFLAEAETGIMEFNAYNRAWQLKAIMRHDIYRSFGGEIKNAAKTVKAKHSSSGPDRILRPISNRCGFLPGICMPIRWNCLAIAVTCLSFVKAKYCVIRLIHLWNYFKLKTIYDSGLYLRTLFVDTETCPLYYFAKRQNTQRTFEMK